VADYYLVFAEEVNGRNNYRMSGFSADDDAAAAERALEELKVLNVETGTLFEANAELPFRVREVGPVSMR
jgi:hypothetical protein